MVFAGLRIGSRTWTVRFRLFCLDCRRDLRSSTDSAASAARRNPGEEGPGLRRLSYGHSFLLDLNSVRLRIRRNRKASRLGFLSRDLSDVSGGFGPPVRDRDFGSVLLADSSDS